MAFFSLEDGEEEEQAEEESDRLGSTLYFWKQTRSATRYVAQLMSNNQVANEFVFALTALTQPTKAEMKSRPWLLIIIKGVIQGSCWSSHFPAHVWSLSQEKTISRDRFFWPFFTQSLVPLQAPLCPSLSGFCSSFGARTRRRRITERKSNLFREGSSLKNANGLQPRPR